MAMFWGYIYIYLGALTAGRSSGSSSICGGGGCTVLYVGVRWVCGTTTWGLSTRVVVVFVGVGTVLLNSMGCRRALATVMSQLGTSQTDSFLFSYGRAHMRPGCP